MSFFGGGGERNSIVGVSRKPSHHGESRESTSKHHRKHHSSHHEKDRGLFSLDSRDRDRSRSRSRTRSVFTARSFFGLDDGRHRHHDRSSHHHSSHNKSTTSFFSLPNVSSRSIFSSFSRRGDGGGSSYYRRSPRSSFLSRAYKKLKRLLRDLVYYAKKHPLKVFMLAVMPLITGGALTALLARFGLRMPPSLERMLGMGAKVASGDSLGLVGDAMKMAAVAGGGAKAVSLERGRSGGLQWERRSVERDYFGGGGGGRSRSAHGLDYGYGNFSGSHSDSGSGWGGSLAGITRMFS